MPKKSEQRRHKRRQQHQSAQTARRQQKRRAIDERVDSVVASLAQLAKLGAAGDVPPAEFTEALLELFAEDELARRVFTEEEYATALAAEVVQAGSAERAVLLARDLEDRLAGEPDLAWVALALADQADDQATGVRLAEKALAELGNRAEGPGSAELRMAADLAYRYAEQARLGDALVLLEHWCARHPEVDDLQRLRAMVMARAVEEPGQPEHMMFFGGQMAPDQAALVDEVLARFGDRSQLYQLREAVEAFIAADPELAALREEQAQEFISQIRETSSAGPFDEVELSALALAYERFWLDSRDQDGSAEDNSVLESFAASSGIAPDLAQAASDWERYVQYGLWLADWQEASDDARGTWLTDILTRRMFYVSLPAEQVENVARWTVLAGAIAPVKGVWRTGQTLFALGPGLADEATEKVLSITEGLLVELAREQGIKPPRSALQPRSNTRPHGVLSELFDPMEATEADITSKVLANSLPNLIGMVEADRRRVPEVRNTDGEEIKLISASFPVKDPGLLRRRLAADIDFEDSSNEAGAPPADSQVTWFGRPMTADESAAALGQFAAESRRRGLGPVKASDRVQRWVRGSLYFETGQVRVEVNSWPRFEALSAKLRAMGAGRPVISRMVEPSMDLAWEGGRLLTGRSNGPEADAAWEEHWVTEKVPALEGATPTAAAKDPRQVVLLEKLLRQFEHDADLVKRSGGSPMDFEPLRARLGMEDGVPVTLGD